MICGKCATENQKGSKFCRSCGSKLRSAPKIRNKPHYKAIIHCEYMIERFKEKKIDLAQQLNSSGDGGYISNIFSGGGNKKKVEGSIEVCSVRIKDHQKMLAILNGVGA